MFERQDAERWWRQHRAALPAVVARGALQDGLAALPGHVADEALLGFELRTQPV